MHKFALLFSIILLCVFPSTVLACKIRVVFPEHLEEDVPEHFYVVRIRKIESDGYSAKIKHSFGGHFQRGRTVFVRFKDNEEAHAICPIVLSVRKTYLLHSDSSSEPMEISRYYGFDMSSKDSKFHGYVQDLAHGDGR